jgi:hypothetical protein
MQTKSKSSAVPPTDPTSEKLEGESMRSFDNIQPQEAEPCFNDSRELPSAPYNALPNSAEEEKSNRASPGLKLKNLFKVTTIKSIC